MTERETKGSKFLLDDEDDQIVNQIVDKIRSLGKEIIPFLEK